MASQKCYTSVSTKGWTREQWQEYRNALPGIGGSDAASVVGVNPFKSPLRLWLEKTGAVDKPDLDGMERVYWGTTLEAIVADEYAKRTGLKVVQDNALHTSTIWPFAFANVDRVVKDPDRGTGGLEVKTASVFLQGEWTEQPPDHYQVQVQHYMAVMGWDWMDVAVLLGGQEYRQFTVLRDEDTIKALMAAEARFMQLITDGTPPALIGHADEAECLDDLYCDPDPGDVLDLSGDEQARVLVQDYLAGKLAEAEGKAKKETAATQLKAMMGNHAKGRCGSAALNWPRWMANRIDTDALKKHYPDVAALVTKPTPGSRFTVDLPKTYE